MPTSSHTALPTSSTPEPSLASPTAGAEGEDLDAQNNENISSPDASGSNENTESTDGENDSGSEGSGDGEMDMPVESTVEEPGTTLAPSIGPTTTRPQIDTTSEITGPIPVTTIMLELAGSASQRLEAVTKIVGEIERTLLIKATFTTTRRTLASTSLRASISSLSFHVYPHTTSLTGGRSLQAAGELCQNADMSRSKANITLDNYDDTVRFLRYQNLSARILYRPSL
jgi:predicted pyridoxine 5'-phosphate oxidase superfamily flavin-nucleotide-binding protein